MAYLVAWGFVSVSAGGTSHGSFANILNAMKMDGRVKWKIVVNDKLVTVNLVKLRLGLE